MIQFVRLLLIAALLTTGAGGLAAQEKTKSKADTQQTASEPELDPNDPEDLEEILSIADDYYFGDTGPVDHAEAFKWYSLASEGGSAYAMNRLGLMYDNGEHVEEDLAEAFHWYELAAEAGLPVAMGNVGNMYEYGDGTGQDYQQALAWYRKGADAGDDYSMLNLGYMFLSGRGVAEDPAEAAAWFQRSADAGSTEGHWMLALRYLYGDGVSMDTQKAADLAYHALINGHQVARDELREIKTADTSPNFRRALQRLLAADGYYKGSIDGSFGPQTQAALDSAFNSAGD